MKVIIAYVVATTFVIGSALYVVQDEKSPLTTVGEKDAQVNARPASLNAEQSGNSGSKQSVEHQLGVLNEKIVQLTGEIISLKQKTTAQSTQDIRKTLSEEEIAELVASDIQNLIEDFNRNPVDNQLQSEIGQSLADYNAHIANIGINVSSFECRSAQCRIDVSGSNPEDVHIVQDYLPFDSESEFLADPHDSTQGILLVTKLEPLFPQPLD